MTGKRIVVLAAAAVLALGCGAGANSTEVGGECASDRDCDNRCTTEGVFGRGMCTRDCTNDKDCPDLSICAEKEGGLCAVSCTSDKDCEEFGRAFLCKTIKRRSGGDGLVCRVP